MDPDWIQVRLRRETRHRLTDFCQRIKRHAERHPERVPPALLSDQPSIDALVNELLRRVDAHAMRASAAAQRKRQGKGTAE